MQEMMLSEFKAKCIAVLKEVQRTREPLLVTLRGKPLATVEPASVRPRGKRLGTLRDSITMDPDLDLVHADTTGDWEMLR